MTQKTLKVKQKDKKVEMFLQIVGLRLQIVEILAKKKAPYKRADSMK